MNVLFICTSNKDRSVALENYFEDVFTSHKYRSAGINKYFTEQKKTHYLTLGDIDWADFIVFAEDIHRDVVKRDFGYECIQFKKSDILNLGEYTKGNVEEDYLTRAELKLFRYLS